MRSFRDPGSFQSKTSSPHRTLEPSTISFTFTFGQKMKEERHDVGGGRSRGMFYRTQDWKHCQSVTSAYIPARCWLCGS